MGGKEGSRRRKGIRGRAERKAWSDGKEAARGRFAERKNLFIGKFEQALKLLKFLHAMCPEIRTFAR
ncbi:MAG TPA: hypothetical protein DCZ73_00480 [Bacteroides sp.]|nr:hypothetical protein [Bacteroides sp.]